MATDFRVDTTFLDHPKTVKLIRRHGIDGLVSLLRLWGFCAATKPKGEFTGADVAEDVEIAARWPGENGQFFSSLVDIGFIDEKSNKAILHNWESRNGWAYHAPERSRKAKRAASKRWKAVPEAEEDAKVQFEHMLKPQSSNAKTPIEHMLKHDSSNAPSPTPTPTPTPNPSPIPDPKPKSNICVELDGESVGSAAHSRPKVITLRNVMDVIDEWNRVAEKHGYQTTRGMRKTQEDVRKRLRDDEFREHWQAAIKILDDTGPHSFLAGKRSDSTWKADITWFCTLKAFHKILDGGWTEERKPADLEPDRYRAIVLPKEDGGEWCWSCEKWIKPEFMHKPSGVCGWCSQDSTSRYKRKVLEDKRRQHEIDTQLMAEGKYGR